MREKPFSVGFVMIVTMLALCGLARGRDITYSFTGMGLHGSMAWGSFTTAEVLGPDYFAPGSIYSSFFLTISNIPGSGPGTVVFLKTELEIFSQFTVSGGVPSILPLGGHDFGPPEQNHYDLGGGVEPNQSTLTYNRAYRDDITWSALTIVSPPLPPSSPVLAVEPGANSVVALSWTTNATGFVLEETASLVPPNWTAVTNVPISTNEIFLVTLSRTDDAHFFRLKWLGQ